LFINDPRMNLRIKAIIAAALFAMPGASSSASPTRWGNLTDWDGHYPTDRIRSVPGNFFTQPSLEAALRQILSPTDRRLFSRYTLASQIERTDGYDILSVCQPHDCPAENATLIFDPNGSTILVAFFSHKGDVISTRWYGTADYTHLPPAVLNEVLWAHEPKP
jgi:hypothetical protein